KELATNESKLKQALDNKQSYLISSLASTEKQVNLIAIAHLKHKPWSVLFALPLSVALAPVEKQIRDAIFLFTIIASIATIIAFAIGQLLTKPIIYLTNIVSQFTAGNLDIRAKVGSKDEIGQLARSFNDMALELQISFETLEQRVQERTAELVIANQKLEQLVNLDGLTQVANRRCFDERLQAEWTRLAREQQPLALILFDVDKFKNYNDYYGHLGGDDCLVRLAQTVQKTVYRPADLVSRYGGEEFSILLPNTDLAGAIQVAQSIQQAIHDLAIPHTKSDVKNIVTVSMGICSLIPSLDIKPDILISSADQALYNAKKKGRDRYCYSSE
ncbi:diguanylate cyclase domain-containing protein, partial [Anabaena sp. UHCC 0451]|uniref:diguanylate cyclase domain-containing protein n=1 Tax=Anabaena sp. UHCC 0451 TaxID=2055235 RepID=UPI002B2211D4